MGVQRQVKKQSPRPEESREHDRPKDDREQPIGEPSNDQLIPVADQEDEEEEDGESTEDPLTDPAAEPGKPI